MAGVSFKHSESVLFLCIGNDTTSDLLQLLQKLTDSTAGPAMEELVNNSDAELGHLVAILKVARVERIDTRQVGQPVKDGAGGDSGHAGLAGR